MRIQQKECFPFHLLIFKFFFQWSIFKVAEKEMYAFSECFLSFVLNFSFLGSLFSSMQNFQKTKNLVSTLTQFLSFCTSFFLSHGIVFVSQDCLICSIFSEYVEFLTATMGWYLYSSHVWPYLYTKMYKTRHHHGILME